MRPHRHAQASAKRAGRAWIDDLAIHELIDVTKIAVPDLRHRIVLHHADLGPELIARAFPTRPHAREVACAHVREDLGADVPLRAWLEGLDAHALPRRRARDLDAMIEDERRIHRLRDHDGPSEVLAFLRRPLAFAPDEPVRAWSLFANAAGIGLARQVLGPPRSLPGVDGREVIFDPQLCAESIVHRVHRRIPGLVELTDAFTRGLQPHVTRTARLEGAP